MAMEPNLAASMQPMYDPRRVITHPKPDSTVPSPPGSENKVEAANDSTLADLASSEISLDLQVRFFLKSKVFHFQFKLSAKFSQNHKLSFLVEL